MAPEADGSQPQRPRLTRDKVVREAISLADEAGLEALTMRSLGDRLGVKAMSLYNHVANKEDLLDAAVDAIYAEIDIPAALDWKVAMRGRAISAREVLAQHPWAIPLMESRTAPGPANLRHHDTVLGVLRAAGFTIQTATYAYSTLDAYIFGFTLQEAALPFRTSDELADVSETIVRHMPLDAFPHLREAATELPASGYSYADQFDAGIDLILGAIDRAYGSTL